MNKYKSLLFVLISLLLLSPLHSNELVQGIGNSMSPTYPHGQWYEVEREYDYSKLKVGDVVVREIKINRNNKRIKIKITHRLNQYIFPFGWITKGDGNKSLDWGFMGRKDFWGLARPVGQNSAR